MFTRQLSSHAIYRLFFSNDPRHVSPTVCTRSSLRIGHWIKGVFVGSSTILRLFVRDRSFFFFFFDPIFGPLLCVVYLCPENLLKRNVAGSFVSNYIRIERRREEKYPFFFLKNYFLLSVTRINCYFVSGGDVLITYFQVH